MFNIFVSKAKEDPTEIPVYYHSNMYDLHPLEYTGDWVDLRACDVVHYYDSANKIWLREKTDYDTGEVFLKKGRLYKIPLGVAMKLPERHEAIIKVRSSTSKNTGLIMASSGVIDEGYSGPNDQWFAVLYATRDDILELGERLVQFRIQKKQPELIFNRVEKLTGPNRGGHGSTGRH